MLSLVDACTPLSAVADSKRGSAGTDVWLEKRLWPEQAVISICGGQVVSQ